MRVAFADVSFVHVPTRQEQKGWQTTGVSEDPADASPPCEELGLTAAHVRQRQQ